MWHSCNLHTDWEASAAALENEKKRSLTWHLIADPTFASAQLVAGTSYDITFRTQLSCGGRPVPVNLHAGILAPLPLLVLGAPVEPTINYVERVS